MDTEYFLLHFSGRRAAYMSSPAHIELILSEKEVQVRVCLQIKTPVVTVKAFITQQHTKNFVSFVSVRTVSPQTSCMSCVLARGMV